MKNERQLYASSNNILLIAASNDIKLLYFHILGTEKVKAYVLSRLFERFQFPLVHVKGQSWGFTSRSTARVILGQVLRIATCGTRTHRGDSL